MNTGVSFIESLLQIDEQKVKAKEYLLFTAIVSLLALRRYDHAQ
jgi:hypothetical protein